MSGGFGSAPFGSAPFGSFVSADLPPVITNWSPFVGAVIGRLGTIQFEVTNDYGAIVETHVVAIYPSGLSEVVFTEEDGFSLLYRRSSARKVLTEGFHSWTLRRTTGWPSASVRISVTATDVAGNVGTGQITY